VFVRTFGPGFAKKLKTAIAATAMWTAPDAAAATAVCPSRHRCVRACEPLVANVSARAVCGVKNPYRKLGPGIMLE
jgi:hypothetical protein